MAAIGTIEQQKTAGYVNTGAPTALSKRIERDEEELRKLEALARGEEEVEQEDDTPPPKQVEAPVEEKPAVEEEVEVMGKRGRKSAAEKAAELEYKKQVLADTYSVMINNEPWRADVYREEYRAKLEDLK